MTKINTATHWCASTHWAQALAAELADRRKAKGMTLEAATQQLCSNPNMYATMMMATGAADGMVSGAIHTTADTMRPALQVLPPPPPPLQSFS